MLLALIIIGPKDLPRVARTIGQWVRKGRMLAREFQTSLEDMAKEAELDDVKKEIEKVGKTDLKKAVESTIDPKGELTKAFDTTDQASDKSIGAKDNGAKALNGSTEAKAGGESQTPVKVPEKPTPKTAATASKTATKTTTPRKKAAAAARKPATAKKPAAAKTARTTKKPAAAKPASTAQSSAKAGDGDPSPSSADDGGGAAMAAKSS